MAKFKVLSTIEHNEKQYWPEPPAGVPDPPKERPGFGSGKPVPVDASGVIELSDADAKQLLVGGAIEPVREKPAKKKEETGKQETGK